MIPTPPQTEQDLPTPKPPLPSVSNVLHTLTFLMLLMVAAYYFFHGKYGGGGAAETRDGIILWVVTACLIKVTQR